MSFSASDHTPTPPPPTVTPPRTYTDPSGLFGAIGAAAAAVLTALVAFGVPLTETQVQAVLGVVAVVGPLWTAVAIRRHAWAPQTVDRRAAEAYAEGVRAGGAA